MIRTFIQISAIGLTIISAVFFAMGNLTLSPQFIAQLSVPRAGEHPGIIISLCNQYASTWVGIVILLAAFGFQIANTIWEMRWVDFAVNKIGLVLSIVFCVIVFIISSWVCGFIAEVQISAVEKVIGYVLTR